MTEYLGEKHLKFWTKRLFAGTSFVYVIQGEDDTPIKIGSAADVAARIAGLQTGTYQHLRLLEVLPGADRLEWQLHKRFAAQRIRGEWFHQDALGFLADLAAWMVAEYKDDGEVPPYRRFSGGWHRFRPDQREMTVRFVEPDPEVVAREKQRQAEVEAEARRRREEAKAHRIHSIGIATVGDPPLPDDHPFHSFSTF